MRGTSTARCAAVIALAAASVACRGRTPSEAAPLRLVDLYRPEVVEGRAAGTPRPSFEWRFDGSPPPAFQASAGVTGLGVRDGRLAGRAATGSPIVMLSRTPPADRDAVHEIQVRLRATGGTNLPAAFRTAEKVDLALETATLPIIPWPFNTPLITDGEAHTYVLRGTGVVPNAARHLLLRPTDAAGATFEIESVRVVSRREHLSGVPSGLGWQGLADVYRETLVARAPERLRFDLDLPVARAARRRPGDDGGRPGDLPRRRDARRGRARDARWSARSPRAHRWESGAGRSRALRRREGHPVADRGVGDTRRARVLGHAGRARRGLRQRDRRRAPRGPRGVIFIWADTLRRDHLPFYGYARPTAPLLARMAAEGAVFDDCVAQASWTKASGPSMMTSLYPTTTTVQSFNDLLPSSATTLAEVYRQAGYATLSLTSIPFVGKFSNMHQGFEELYEPGAYPEAQTGSQKSARAQVDRLLPWLDAHRDTPFFVLLHVRDPHSPHRPYPPYDTMWSDPARAAEHARQLEVVRPLIKNPNMRPRGMPSRADLVEAGLDPGGVHRRRARLVRRVDPRHGRGDRTAPRAPRRPRPRPAARWSPSWRTTARSSWSTDGRSTSRASTASWRTCRCSSGGRAWCPRGRASPPPSRTSTSCRRCSS